MPSFALFAGGTFSYIFLAISILFYLTVINFFRYEPRKHSDGPLEIVCPADGRVVVVEETEETGAAWLPLPAGIRLHERL